MSPPIEVIRSIHFGSLLAQKSLIHTFNLKNPSRRKLVWKILVSEDYKDIFSVCGHDCV